MKILENISLKDLTTFNIGGNARYFCVVATAGELKESVQFAREQAVPIFILGGGSNILVSDDGFHGLVIKMGIMGIHVSDGSEMAQVTVGAGEVWDDFVAFAVDHGFGGLENLSLIPGTVGAAPVQNIGAYGAEVQNAISAVEVFDTEKGELQTMKNADCHFDYRHSIFKKPEGRKYVITRVIFSLSKTPVLAADYKDIADYISKNNVTDLTIKKNRDIVISIRTAKLPDVKKIGTAGSFFKNPIIEAEKYNELKKQYPDMPHFPTEKPSTVKIPAAWLLDKVCGFKGYRNGAVGVYQNQALVLVNFGGAQATEILDMAQTMSDCVRQKTGIELEREVQVIT